MNSNGDNLPLLIWQSFLSLSGWEVLATLLGIIYIILATRESIWCWPAAFFSTLIYTFLFWKGQLPMQALLNAYYLIMAIYGWTLWRKHRDQQDDLSITTRPAHFHLAFISIGFLLTLLTAYYLEHVIESRLPYLDAAVTVFSVMNTVLMARKVLENWLYWLVIDAATIVLYWQTGYYVTITMFTVYLVLAVIGYLKWKQLYSASRSANSPT